MQSEVENTGTICIETFDSASAAVKALTVNISDSTSYYAGKKAKGDGFGTDAGWYVGNINGALTLSTEFMNLKTNCSFDYYIQGFGKFTQSLDGFINLGISMVFRAFLDDSAEFNQ